MNENMAEEYLDNNCEDDCDCNHGPEYEYKDQHGCTKVTYQYAEVSVPIKVTPYAKVGKIETKCCGTPVLTESNDCGCNGGCELEICQTICVKIPIEYRSLTSIGDHKVKCGEAAHSCKCFNNDKEG